MNIHTSDAGTAGEPIHVPAFAPGDRAAQILHQFQAAIAAQDAYPVGTPLVLCDRIETLGRELSWQGCDSPVAALHMIGAAMAEGQALSDMAARDGAGEYRIEVTTGAMMRLLSSVMAWVEETHDIKREDYGLEYFSYERAERAHWGLPVGAAS